MLPFLSKCVAMHRQATLDQLLDAMVLSGPRNIKLSLYNESKVGDYFLSLSRLEMSGRHLTLKLQRLQNKVLCTNGNFPRCTLVRDLHAAFNLP
jgi:hypothetical protein